MSFIHRLFRRSDPIAPVHHVSSGTVMREWWSLSGPEQTSYEAFFLKTLQNYFASYVVRQQPLLIIDHEFCQHDKRICIEFLPIPFIIENVKKVTEKPFTIVPTKDCYVISYVHNLERVTALLPPSQHLAKAAVRDALARREVCALTQEPLADIAEYCVGMCGHVFSVSVSLELACPICREPVAWTRVKAEDIQSI